MFDMTGSLKEIKKFLGEMLEKHGIDEDKWREDLNSLPKTQRSMVLTFDTDDVKQGFVVKFNFIFSAVEIIIKDEKVLKDFKAGNME